MLQCVDIAMRRYLVLNEIQEQFNKVITYSQGIAEPKTDKLFADWKINKANFIQAFGKHKLIYEYPEKVQVELNDDAKEGLLQSLRSTMLNDIYPELATFIEHEKEGFFQNKVIKEYWTIDGKFIPKGMKLLKAFKYFVEDDPVKLNEYQMKASNLIQQNKIEGTLCFSVHPLDYLSSSENTHNWHSCHSLNGSYRAGNLSYMTDESTILVYLKSDEDTKLPHFPSDVPWNNKKWRMLLHFNWAHAFCFAGRQYPFHSNNLLNKVLEIMNTNNDNWMPWQNEYYTETQFGDIVLPYYERQIPMIYGSIPITKFIEDCHNPLHYNDILYSHLYDKPYYTAKIYNHTYRPEAQNPLMIGHEVKCLDCGKHSIYSKSNTMRCFVCELENGTESNDTFGYCDCCGERVVLDDCVYSDATDNVYCAACADDVLRQCHCCGGECEIDQGYIDEDDNFYCSYCAR